MVAVLYALILIPVVIYLIFSILEIWSIIKISRKPKSKAHLYLQITGELTHTILVFGYAQFMITHSSLLTEIGAALYYPAALLMTSLIIRGAIYLYTFYAKTVPRITYPVFITTYILGIASLVWGLAIVIPEIIATGYTPDTSSISLVTIVAPFVLAILIIPTTKVYREAIKKIK
jgi:hypothetical protein